MLPRQPRSTLFPYTTLFRSNDQVWQADGNKTFVIPSPESFRGRGVPRSYVWVLRSEEHTSELQSHSDLVCRLLLEKKKKKKESKCKYCTSREIEENVKDTKC